MSYEKTRCGYVAIVGRPNVGKSTLLNHILGQKISITSDKPQTTQHQILGIKTAANAQTIYIDTPGLHQSSKRLLNRYMNRAAWSVLSDANVIIFMIDARYWTKDDEWIFERIKTVKNPVILALNKVDLVKDKKSLLPILETLHQKMSFAGILPMSAMKRDHLVTLEAMIEKLLPEQTYLFPTDQITDREDKFFIAEIIREKVIRLTGQEVPYDIAVIVDDVKLKENILHIHVTIWVQRPGQKAIIIGQKGARLKQVGSLARAELEKLFQCKVFLGLWVKIKTGWSEDEKFVSSLV